MCLNLDTSSFILYHPEDPECVVRSLVVRQILVGYSSTSFPDQVSGAAVFTQVLKPLYARSMLTYSSAIQDAKSCELKGHSTKKSVLSDSYKASP